jgi:hypothetical protein
MSTKRSWDIQPKQKREASVKQSPAPIQTHRRPIAAVVRKQPERRTVNTTQQTISNVSLHSIPKAQERLKNNPVPAAKGHERESLKERRRRARRRAIAASVLLVLVLGGGIVSVFWMKIFRIQSIAVAGPDSEEVQTIASAVISGNYDYLLPRNSIFFFPETEIRNHILQQYPDISAVSISRTSLNSIAIASIPRQVAMDWCGASYAPSVQSVTVIPATSASTSTSTTTAAIKTASTTPATTQVVAPPTCYSADAQGIIFAQASQADASSSEIFHLYAPLLGTASDTSPIGATIAQASVFPRVFEFIKAIKSFGVPIVGLVLRGDEVDLYAESGTRITYVLGQEQSTLMVAKSIFPSINVNDGSIQYVDLRFPGKAYYKASNSSSGRTS